MRGLPAFALLALLLLAGCSGSPDAEPMTATVPEGAPAPMANATLYEFSGPVQGARVANPEGGGPVDDHLPVAKQDTLVVPDGADDVTVVAEVLHATEAGNGRIEIYGADGQLAFESETWSCTGTDAAGACLPAVPATEMDPLPPGAYTVDYLVSGQLQVSLTVTAQVPAPAA